MKKLFCIFALAASAALLCSCASEEQRSSINVQLIDIKTDSVSEDATSPAESTTALQEAPSASESEEPADSTDIPADGTDVIDEEPKEPVFTAPPVVDPIAEPFYIDDYAAYYLTPEERSFTDRSIFVGDSICLGYSVYKFVGEEHVFARGSLAARNFYEFEFYSGEEKIDFAQALERSSPELVFLSMGMNDINMTDEQTYCENYRAIIEQVLAQTQAEVYVAAITPIDSEFSTNYRIDCFNVAMRGYIEENFGERVHFLDFAKHLKDADGKLKECFNGGDGIHLSPYAYYVALWEIDRQTRQDGVR